MSSLSRNVSLAALLAVLGASSALAQGAVATDKDGADGYQHSIEKSRFSSGADSVQMSPVEEFGFAKIKGRNGVFATNLRNGLVVATQNDGVDKGDEVPQSDAAKAEHLSDPDKHNAMVMDYFLAAGLPRDQVSGVHATTYLTSRGSTDDAAAAPRVVEGYASVLGRVVGGKFPVAESVAWARLDGDGRTVTEWVYWPPIPAKALADAARLDELTNGPRRDDYLGRLPQGLRNGQIVIHHTDASDERPFEALATFDVIDARGVKAEDTGKMTMAPRGSVIVRHFDAAGNERRLPSETFSLGETDPASK